MNITYVELNNFQKHSFLHIDFKNSVNVICGESAVGKSCIIRAIRWVLTNEPKGESVRKEGSDETVVTLSFDNGLLVTRVKSNSVNRYISEIGGEKKIYNSIGKNIPEEILRLTNIRPIDLSGDSVNLNISKQLEAPFLFCEKGSYRMKVFNKLSGNDVLDLISQDFNKEKLGISRSVNEIKSNLEAAQKDYASIFEFKNALIPVLHFLEEKYKEVTDNTDRYNSIEEIKQGFDKASLFRHTVISSLAEIFLKNVDDELSGLKEKISRFNELSKLFSTFVSVREMKSNMIIPEIDIDSVTIKIKSLLVGEKLFDGLEGLFSQIKAITQIIKVTKGDWKKIDESIPEEIKRLQGIHETGKVIQESYSGLKKCSKAGRQTQSAIAVVESEIDEENNKRKIFFEAFKSCPFCGQELSKEKADLLARA